MENSIHLKLKEELFNSLVEMAFIGNVVINGHRFGDKKLRSYNQTLKKVMASFLKYHKKRKTDKYQEIKSERDIGDYFALSTGDLVDEFEDANFPDWFAFKLSEYEHEGYFGKDKDTRISFAERVYLEEF